MADGKVVIDIEISDESIARVNELNKLLKETKTLVDELASKNDNSKIISGVTYVVNDLESIYRLQNSLQELGQKKHK